MAGTYAKLRSDIEIRRESPDPQASVIVKDPVARRFYRFTWIQAAVLAGLDGTNAAHAVAETASAQCQVSVEERQVEDFVRKLESLLLLDDGVCWSRLEQLAGRKRPLADNLLSIKIHAFNPERLLSTLHSRLGAFFFGGAFSLVALASATAAAILTILNWNELYFSLPRIFTLYSVPLILAVAFLVMTVHEFGHALTLAHFGGRVREMGLMVLYFIPGFYCNVGDAWLLPRRERMLVSLAGGLVQTVVWAWATILWRILAPETLASHVCMIAIAFSGIQTLFNFNPLLRMDGYYLLSDLLMVPNLRRKSFVYLRGKLGFWLGTTGRGTPAPPREKWIFTLYGISAFAFSATLLFVVLSRFGGWMVAEYGTWGIILFTGICLMVVPGTGKDNPPAASRPANGARRKPWKSPVTLTCLALILVGSFIPWELKVTGDFTILPGSAVAVHSQVEGTLKTIVVDEGSWVRREDVIAELQNLELSNTYEETRGELAGTRASLNLLKAGSRPEEIEKARNVVETRRTDLENAGRVEQERQVLQEIAARKEAALRNAQSNYERTRTLYGQGLIARNELERDQTAFTVAQKESAEAGGQLKVLEERTERERQIRAKALTEAQSELKILLAGARKESIDAVAAGVAKLEEKLNILEQQLAQLKVRSPIDGVVATPYLKNRIGEYLERGRLLCQIVDVRQANIDIPIPEKEIADVAPGYPIVMKVNAFPKQSFLAQVKSISPVAVTGDAERKVVVRGELPNPDGRLKAGMTGVAKIHCGKRLIGELLTRRLIRWIRTEFWEYLP